MRKILDTTMPFVYTRDMAKIRGGRITVMGLGLFGGGVGVIKYLASHGARVTVTDAKSAEQLRESIRQLDGFDIAWHLGRHDVSDFEKADLVVVNPAVPDDSPYVASAVRRGVPLETEMNLFFKLCKGVIIGITGSNGKTTTTALIGEILKSWGKSAVIGGNIGRSLLEEADDIPADSWVVLELSSFQLDNLASLGRSPHISAITNITPNHLDRHGTMEKYIEAKRAIIRFQKSNDIAVLNADDAVVSAMGSATAARKIFLTIRGAEVDGISYADGILRYDAVKIDISGRKLLGWFNVQNMASAAAATLAVDEADQEGWRRSCETVFNSFKGVEHRLEFVGEYDGVRYYNDSIATNPESTIAALDALGGPFILIAGGYDKNLPFDALGREIARRVKRTILIGQTAGKIADAIEREKGGGEVTRAGSLKEAVAAAKGAAVRGDIVLLSPACASYDMFRNFAERGNLFKEAVR